MSLISKRFQAPNLTASLPPDWDIALAAVSKYFHWSREDAWNCTVDELRFWVSMMQKLEAREEES